MIGDSGERLLLENRNNLYEDVFAAEMQAFEDGSLAMIVPGLWSSKKPLDRQRLGQLASLRGEMAPLTGPYSDMESFLEAVQKLPRLPVDGWSLFHVRLDNLERGTPKSMVLALEIAQAMQTKPHGGEGGGVLVVVETKASLYLCLATESRSTAVLLTPAVFKSRPFNFAAALDPALAAVALNKLCVGRHDVLLDPCCGTGTILVGGIERGAQVIGCDQSFKFAVGTRANLDHFGFASVGGGALRSRTGWDGACAVAHHDARQPFDQEFPSMPTPTVVVSNVPHGRYLVLPYEGYLRDIISNLAAFAPAARFCLIGGEGCTQEKGPDNIGEILDTLGFEQQSTVKCRKLYLTFALGPCHVDNKRQMKWAASEA